LRRGDILNKTYQPVLMGNKPGNDDGKSDMDTGKDGVSGMKIMKNIRRERR